MLKISTYKAKQKRLHLHHHCQLQWK